MFFRQLLRSASILVLAAFQNKDWSNITVVDMLCFMARLQTKSNVDRMHDLSPDYIDHRQEFDLQLPKVLVSMMQICIISETSKKIKTLFS
ncbi:hypothetical protein DPMN_129476 [Dreissena polymorpha]|uniref:Uncharacterized protein n=1 Tax=Dreissena polymorpha TaxID=45954 RepID=A0A9D4JWP2_DREPO|nr:hypothetical protein DPMN_129476 [Dreissena polymorpha]